MRPELLFMVGIDQIKVPTLSGRGERFLEEYFLTNDKTFIRALISPWKLFIGSVEFGYLVKSCPALAYRKQAITESEFVAARDDLDRFIIKELQNILAFIRNLWVVKDNAAYFDRGWLCIKSDNSIYCHNNTYGNRASDSEGGFNSIDFSPEELKYARLPKTSMFSPIQDSGLPTALGHETLRYQRFTYFISGARQTNDIGLKIAQYVTALEALVSSSTTEVTHQVAERVACLINPPGDSRIDDYRQIKQAYNIRSKVVHGAFIRGNQFEQLKKISRYLDETCRILTIRYLGNENEFRNSIESEKIEAFFLEKLLSNA
jgi:hypothetical protein